MNHQIKVKPNSVYISGGITGKANSYTEFALAEEKINALGFNTINPHEICIDIKRQDFETEEQHWKACMKRCVAYLSQCEIIVTLHNWAESKGAVKEVNIARELGFIDVVFIETFLAKYSK